MSRDLKRFSGKKGDWVFAVTGFLVLAVMEFILHRQTPFMMDDLWYGTNLVTGDSLKNLRDVMESQIWHYYNWGGRSINHGILQLVLMAGELAADMLNLIMTMFLTGLIMRLAKERSAFAFSAGFLFLVALNPNFKMSMFWQSGAVNYVYSSVWIMFFVMIYLSCIEEAPSLMLSAQEKQMTQAKQAACFLLILPLGLITGWSNENMGPASFVLAVCAVFYRWKVLHKKPALWMIGGALASLCGSAIMLLAPGNFVRKEIVAEKTLSEEIYDRFFSMLRAGTDYLFPVLVLTFLLLLVQITVLKQKADTRTWFLLGYALLSYGAMILSPHYPDRAVFGTMVVLIAVILSAMGKIMRKAPFFKQYFMLLYFSVWCYALFRFGQEFYSLKI